MSRVSSYVELHCELCGKWITGQGKRFCSTDCAYLHKTGENNVMRDPKVARRHREAVRRSHNKLSYRRAVSARVSIEANTPEGRAQRSKNMQRYWDSHPERKLSQSLSQRKGSARQKLMQRNGNMLRKGIPNQGASDWAKENPRLKAIQVQRALKTMAERGVLGAIDIGKPGGKKGIVSTRFGEQHFNSGWEAAVLTRFDMLKSIVRIKRDKPIPYKLPDDTRHLFLVDFVLYLRDGTKLLVEIKPSITLKRDPKTRYKLRAGRRYARKRHMRFVVLTSIASIEEFHV